MRDMGVKVSLADLKALPVPVALGNRHKPVPHYDFLTAALESLEREGIGVKSTSITLANKGQQILAILETDFNSPENDFGCNMLLRNSVNQVWSALVGLGRKVFACMNGMVVADFWPLYRRNTLGLNIFDAMPDAVSNYLAHARDSFADAAIRKATAVNDSTAKGFIYDIFADQTLPIRLFPDVHREYFATPKHREMHGHGTVWSLENAFTAAFKSLKPVPFVEHATSLNTELRRLTWDSVATATV